MIDVGSLAETKTKMASVLEQMPDIVLLNILGFLNIDDLINLSKCGCRFNEFCSEQLVVR